LCKVSILVLGRKGVCTTGYRDKKREKEKWDKERERERENKW